MACLRYCTLLRHCVLCLISKQELINSEYDIRRNQSDYPGIVLYELCSDRGDICKWRPYVVWFCDIWATVYHSYQAKVSHSLLHQWKCQEFWVNNRTTVHTGLKRHFIQKHRKKTVIAEMSSLHLFIKGKGTLYSAQVAECGKYWAWVGQYCLSWRMSPVKREAVAWSGVVYVSFSSA